MKRLDDLAQAVWNAPDLESAKLHLNEMVDQFQYKAKQDAWRLEIDKIKSLTDAHFKAGALVNADQRVI